MTIRQETDDLNIYWNDLIYTICKGNAGEMREVVKLDIFDFFSFVEHYTKGLKNADRR